MPAPVTTPTFSIGVSHDRPEGELPCTQTYEGTETATDESIWTVTRVDDDPEHGTYVQLHAVDPATDGPTRTADPDALRGLAAVLVAQARLLEIEDPGYSTPLAAGRDLAIITDAWETWGGDSWDVAGGIVAIHREITQRLAWMARDMLAALDGDEGAAETWEFDQMKGPRRDEDVADALNVPPDDLRTTLIEWSQLIAK